MTPDEKVWPTLVYLDQNGWIELAKIEYKPKKSEDEVKFLEKIYRKVDEGKILFPLSIVHFDETGRISNEGKRKQLAILMAKLSKGYSISPSIESHVAVEVQEIILKKMGFPGLDLKNIFIKKGIENLVNAKGKLVSKDGDPNKKPPKEIEDIVKKALDDPSTFELLLTKIKPGPEITAMQNEAALKMNKIRQRLLEIKDKDLRRRTYTVQCISDIILHELAEQLQERGLPRDFILTEGMSKKELEQDFLDKVPTSLVLTSLLLHRDLQFERPITINDISDVWCLALSIPYCDIVITDKEMASFATQSKLDKKCDTIILTSIHDLLDNLKCCCTKSEENQ